MDILHGGDCDGFCIVSSDSDFTRLATRLRESGKYVIGIGEQKTPQPFIVSCDKFIYIEILETINANEIKKEDNTAKRNSSYKLNRGDRLSDRSNSIPEEIIELLKNTIGDVADDSGWAFLGDVGNSIIKKKSDFDSRNYGFEKLSYLIKKDDQHFVVDSRDVEGKPIKHIYVKVK